MILFIVLLFAIPIIEIAVMVQVAQWIGTGQMLALLISVSVIGVWIVKRQGIGVLRRIRAELEAGRIPGAHLVDGGDSAHHSGLRHRHDRARVAVAAGARARTRTPRPAVPTSGRDLRAAHAAASR